MSGRGLLAWIRSHWAPLLSVAAGVALLVAMRVALRREEPGLVAPVSDALAGTRTIELFFPGNTEAFQQETREILGSDFVEQDVRRAVEELIAGPDGGVHPIPPNSKLLAVFFDGDGEITLNFSDHLRADHPGGSEAEIETLRCLVTTIGRNFPGVDRVRILIDGEAVSTLAGHTDLSRPLGVDELH